jgi:hypothetical protein
LELGGGFLYREPAEESQLDYLSGLWIDLGEAAQRFVNGEELHRRAAGDGVRIFQDQFVSASTAPASAAAAGMFAQNPPHQQGRDSQEVGPIVPPGPFLIG